MNKKVELFFDQDDFFHFREWINLNIEEITWQERHKAEFEEFWSVFFLNGLSLSQTIDRFQYVASQAKLGPLVSWFNWLKNKFILYTFVHKDISICDLTQESKMPIAEVSGILRNFFIIKFPMMNEEIESIFQIRNITNPNIHLTFNQLAEKLELQEELSGDSDDEIMTTLEVTLYKEWKTFLKKIKQNLYNPRLNLKDIQSKSSIKKQLHFFKEITLLLIIGIGLIYGVRYANQWYERYLSNKIKVHEPQFLWLDQNLKFKNLQEQDGEAPNIDFEKVELVDSENSALLDEDISLEFSEESSNIMLTSWDSLPKDFDIAELEQSEYEERRKGGYRDTRFGNRTVYRVMMRSVDARDTSGKLNKLLARYNASQTDNVKPGTKTPGGIYYNLVVPRKFLKEFLAQVMAIDEAILYESRTRRANPPGKSKVMIWIKIL